MNLGYLEIACHPLLELPLVMMLILIWFLVFYFVLFCFRRADGEKRLVRSSGLTAVVNCIADRSPSPHGSSSLWGRCGWLQPQVRSRSSCRTAYLPASPSCLPAFPSLWEVTVTEGYMYRGLKVPPGGGRTIILQSHRIQPTLFFWWRDWASESWTNFEQVHMASMWSKDSQFQHVVPNLRAKGQWLGGWVRSKRYWRTVEVPKMSSLKARRGEQKTLDFPLPMLLFLT